MTTIENIVGSDVVLFWLDDHIGQRDNCTKLKEEFESNTTNLYVFHDVDQCRRFLPKIGSKKPFCIIQGKHAQAIVPDIIKYSTAAGISPVVYIFCLYTETLSEWAQDIRCVQEGGIFTHEHDLLTRLATDLADYADLKVQEYSMKRRACEEWAQNLTKRAKRFRTEQCTATFKTDPTNNEEPSGVQPTQ